MFYTPSMSEKLFNGIYLVVDALAVLIIIPYVLYKLSGI